MKETINYSIIQQVTKSAWDLYGHIEDFEHYADLIEQLGKAGEQDLMVININSLGGRCDVGFMIVRAIKESSATVVANVVWPSASMASIIACACDELYFDPYTYLMFHAYSGGSYGKADDVIQDTKASHWGLEGSFKAVVSPFLTDKEIQKMFDGKDIYVRSDDTTLDKRIKRHFFKGK